MRQRVSCAPALMTAECMGELSLAICLTSPSGRGRTNTVGCPRQEQPPFVLHRLGMHNMKHFVFSRVFEALAIFGVLHMRCTSFHSPFPNTWCLQCCKGYVCPGPLSGA